MTANATIPASVAAGHPAGADRAYASANAAWATTLAMDPIAAAAAKRSPCSAVRNTETGADVKGKPTSHPDTAGPKRRPRRVALAMSAGVTATLMRRIELL